jgi:hypothetical protein
LRAQSEEGDFRVGGASRSRQHYELIREQSIAGGKSTGKKGGAQ